MHRAAVLLLLTLVDRLQDLDVVDYAASLLVPSS
jgi:hypothetical protein